MHHTEHKQLVWVRRGLEEEAVCDAFARTLKIPTSEIGRAGNETLGSAITLHYARVPGAFPVKIGLRLAIDRFRQVEDRARLAVTLAKALDSDVVVDPQDVLPPPRSLSMCDVRTLVLVSSKGEAFYVQRLGHVPRSFEEPLVIDEAKESWRPIDFAH